MPTVIEAQIRIPEGKNANRRIRKSGKIPAVVYGPGKEPKALSLDPVDIQTILRSESGRNTIFGVNIEGTAQRSAMIKAYQLDPVKGKLIHVDLLDVAMDRMLTLMVKVELVGEPRGVKLEGCSLDFVTRAIQIECMPADIPESIKLEIGELGTNEYIRAKNINLGEKVNILTEPDVVIVTVSPPRKSADAASAAEPEAAPKG